MFLLADLVSWLVSLLRHPRRPLIQLTFDDSDHERLSLAAELATVSYGPAHPAGRKVSV